MNNSKITRDARVAEIVGYTFWRYIGAGYDHGRLVAWSPAENHIPYPDTEWKQLKVMDIDSDDKFVGGMSGRASPPFISAPDGNTDQIVLEWVQHCQENHIVVSFFEELEIIHRHRDATTPEYMYHLKYKPGDYALALLEVVKDGH